MPDAAVTAERGASPGPPSRPAGEAAAQRAFSTSMLISAIRCLLSYIVFPFVAPALGFAAGVGPGIGIVIGLVAIVANVLTIRRFHRAAHRWRWMYSAVAASVIGLLLIFMVQDIARIAGVV